jgi:hypothetical protein
MSISFRAMALPLVLFWSGWFIVKARRHFLSSFAGRRTFGPTPDDFAPSTNELLILRWYFLPIGKSAPWCFLR